MSSVKLALAREWLIVLAVIGVTLAICTGKWLVEWHRHTQGIKHEIELTQEKLAEAKTQLREAESRSGEASNLSVEEMEAALQRLDKDLDQAEEGSFAFLREWPPEPLQPIGKPEPLQHQPVENYRSKVRDLASELYGLRRLRSRPPSFPVGLALILAPALYVIRLFVGITSWSVREVRKS